MREISAAPFLLLAVALSAAAGCAGRPPTWLRLDGKDAQPKRVQLVFTRIEMQKTPRDDAWLFCFEARAGGMTNSSHVRGYHYSEAPVIPLNVKLGVVRPGEPVDVVVRMDRDEGRVCTDRAEDFVKFRLPVSPPPGGSMAVVPHPRWSFVLYWSTEEVPSPAK